ncbi:CDC45 family [Catenaria anguillulae PL171]|uniref:CDC45 family n=1 Tax=Catenaria anguillulae PL171 TaxID=765915 RepID=A0A1Y2H8V6_9FUNG|nr:CDC45 family [Catenaria anguillulae PL171]
MYRSIDDLESLYAAIVSSASQSAGAQTVMLLVPPELDAVCACKLLVSQLRIDYIAHRILPVSSYSDIRQACHDLPNLPDVSSIILINCGGMLPVGLLPNQRVYVIESRRPLNLDNLFASEYVYVVDGDGMVDRDLVEERDAYVAMVGADDDEDDDEDDNDQDEDEDLDIVEEDDDDDDDGFASDPDDTSASSTRRKRKRPRTSSPERTGRDTARADENDKGGNDNDDDDTDVDADESTSAGPKSPIFEPPPNQEDKENLGAFSTAALASGLPSSPSRSRSRPRSRSRQRDQFATIDSASSSSDTDQDDSNNDRPPLWPPRHPPRANARAHTSLALAPLIFNYYGQGTWLGTASALIMYRLITQLGRATPDAAWLAAVGVTAQAVNEEIARARYEACMSELDADIAQMVHTAQAAGAGAGAGAGVVSRATVDWRLPLYRHWSLLDALTCARGPAARLATWTEQGISRIRYLFAKLGVPLDEYSKPYVHMDKRARGVVDMQLAGEAPTVGLDPQGLQWKCVTRSTGEGKVVSAADVVDAVAAIASGGLPAAAMTTQGMLTGIGADAFYAMMGALGSDVQVGRGIEAAKCMVKETMRVAGTLITRRAIKTLRGLRYVLVRDVGDAMGALRTPWGVKQLALALGAALREVGRADLPLVVGVLQPRTGGAEAAAAASVEGDDDEPEGMVKRNKVGLAFQYAAADVQARVAQEWFDPSVLWIDKEDVTDFLEVLQGRLAAPE